MVERAIRRPRRVRLRRPVPPPPADKPVLHVPKKPKLASTGTKVDRLCAICLGKLIPGVAITFCKCGKFFHLDCISELRTCPLCQHEMEFSHMVVDEVDVFEHEDDVEEEIYEEFLQCPICEAVVPEDATECKCGVQFDTDIEIYTCPECDAEIDPDDIMCPNCGLSFR